MHFPRCVSSFTSIGKKRSNKNGRDAGMYNITLTLMLKVHHASKMPTQKSTWQGCEHWRMEEGKECTRHFCCHAAKIYCSKPQYFSACKQSEMAGTAVYGHSARCTRGKCRPKTKTIKASFTLPWENTDSKNCTKNCKCDSSLRSVSHVAFGRVLRMRTSTYTVRGRLHSVFAYIHGVRRDTVY